jgi:hypothetical protein
MSYDIHLFSRETKLKAQKKGQFDFFDDDKNFEPFTDQQIKELMERLTDYGYEFIRKDEFGSHYSHEEFGISASLANNGLYFSTSGDEDDIFEMGMTVSEFTDSGEFEKYDPQNGGWEEID